MSSLFNQASLVLVPSGYKAGKVYSEVPTNGDGDLTFTRASSATRVNSAGLIESPRTNLVLYSEEFDNASWLKTEISITANTITSPDGTLTADTLSIGVDASAVRHRLLQTKTTTIGTTYTGTYYLKANEHQWVQICGVIGYSNGVWANFDLVNGTIGNTGGVDTTASIENVGNGWYRCRVSGVATGTSTTGFEIIVINNKNSGRYPSYQSLVAEDVCYVWGAQLEVGSTATEYIPTTNSARTTFAGITQDGTSASNVPRLDYSQGSCPALLLEPQRTNLALYSEEFDDAYWLKANVTITANQETSPDGTQNADTLLATSGMTSFLYRSFTLTSGTPYTFSIYVKKKTITALGNRFRINFVNNLFINFNGSVPVITGGSGIVENAGNGFYRIITTVTPSVTSNTLYIYPDGNNNNADEYYIWGAQLEAGSYATSYIPTTSATVTRLADSCSKTGISSLIGDSEGWIYGEVQGITDTYGSTSTILSVSDGTTNNRVQFSFNAAQNIVTPRIFVGGSTIFVGDISLTITNKFKFAVQYSGTTAVCYINGTLVASTSGLTFFADGTLNKVSFDQGNGTALGFGNVSQVLIGQTALTPTQLAELTTL